MAILKIQSALALVFFVINMKCDDPPNGLPPLPPDDGPPIDTPTLAPEVLSGPGPLIDWSTCSAPCDGGEALYSVGDCAEEGCSTYHSACNTQPCLDPWGPFSQCNSTCDGGYRERTRSDTGDIDVSFCNMVPCQAPASPTCQLDIYYIIDESSSITEVRYNMMKRLTSDIISYLSGISGITHTAFTFSQDTREIFAGVTGSHDVSDALSQHSYRGGSGSAANAVAKLRDYVNSSPHTTKVTLWMTDYPDITLVDTYMLLADHLKSLIDMHAISIGQFANINMFANSPTQVYPITNPLSSSAFLNNILSTYCGETFKEMDILNELANELNKVMYDANDGVCVPTMGEWSQCKHKTTKAECGAEWGRKSRKFGCMLNGEYQEAKFEVQTKYCWLPKCTTTTTTTTTTAPPTTTTEPTTTTTEPTTTTTEPTTSTATTTTAPPTTTTEPTTTTTEPTTTTPPPSTTTPPPSTTTTEPTTTTTLPTTTVSETTTKVVIPNPDSASECRMCDYSKGQGWLEVMTNCHEYIVCIRYTVQEEYKYVLHRRSCGELFWDQRKLTCVTEKVGLCTVGVVRTTTTKSSFETTQEQCPYLAIENGAKFTSLQGDYEFVCPENTVFNEDECTCVRKEVTVTPTCTQDMLLYFPFTLDLNDVTCTKAKGYSYGEGRVKLRWDDDRSSMVAVFDGKSRVEVPYMRNWHEGQNITQWTMTAWVKRSADNQGIAGVIDNGNCWHNATYAMYTDTCSGESCGFGGIATEDASAKYTEKKDFPYDVWTHLAVIYDGQYVNFYIDKQFVSKTLQNGKISSNHNPMFIGMQGCCGIHMNYFKGKIDEVRIWKYAISLEKLNNLP